MSELQFLLKLAKKVDETMEIKREKHVNGNNELKNRYLHIRWNEKVDIEQKKWILIRIKWTLKRLKFLKQ